jgi:Protein of unknown function (DUF2505)
MTEIHADAVLAHPRQVVYETYRDRLPELTSYLPNVDKILVLENRREGDILHLVNEWVARAEIPKVVRAFIKPEMLRWKDIATWHDDDHSVDWRFEMAFMREQVDVRGHNRFVRVGDDRARVEIRGTLTIDGNRIPGVPRLVGRRIAPQIEKFVLALVTPNLIKTAEGVGRFLDEED